MKKGILGILLVITVVTNAQSLKDALYGGKLKNDSGSVIRKTDSLSTKIDTTKKKPVEVEKNKITAPTKDSAIKSSTVQTDSAKTVNVTRDTVAATSPVKTNNQIWKAYIDSATSQLKREVLPDKKIKSGTYYILVDYDIDVDGKVIINNATPDPADRFLQEQVREILEAAAPKMSPLLSNGKPRKVTKKYNFILSKE
jgi:hypothetical protein